MNTNCFVSSVGPPGMLSKECKDTKSAMPGVDRLIDQWLVGASFLVEYICPNHRTGAFRILRHFFQGHFRTSWQNYVRQTAKAKLSYTELLTSAWESPNQLNQVWGFSSENPSSMLRKLHSFQLPSGFKSANVTWGFPAVPAASVRPVVLSNTTWSPSQEHCTPVRAKQASGAALADQRQTQH